MAKCMMPLALLCMLHMGHCITLNTQTVEEGHREDRRVITHHIYLTLSGTSKCVTNNGGTVALETCISPQAATQSWTKPVGGQGQIRFGGSSDLCLVPNGYNDNDSPPSVASCSGAANSVWTIGTATEQIVNQGTNGCLHKYNAPTDTTNRMMMYSCSGSDVRQKWTWGAQSYTPDATATGDPHMVNMMGEKFDILQRGRHLLIQIPGGGDPEHTLLRVEADVTGGKKCDYSFITMLNVTGKWAEEKKAGGVVYRAIHNEKDRRKIFLDVGPIELKIVKASLESGMTYLNFKAMKLSGTGLRVGGLLGEDDHARASSKEACVLGEDAGNVTVSAA